MQHPHAIDGTMKNNTRWHDFEHRTDCDRVVHMRKKRTTPKTQKQTAETKTTSSQKLSESESYLPLKGGRHIRAR